MSKSISENRELVPFYDTKTDPVADSPSELVLSEREEGGCSSLTVGPCDDNQNLVHRANEALRRVATTGEDWLVVAQAYQHGRRLAMTLANANQPVGKAYNKAFSDWCKRTRFDLDSVNAQTRTAMGHIMDNLTAFNTWRTTLTRNKLELWNHPCTMWRHFAAMNRTGQTKANAEARPSARAKTSDLRVENEVLKAKLAKAQDGQLLVDLAHDDPATIVRALVHDSAAQRNPKGVARLYRMAADQLDPPAKRQALH
jgi:hypothetical protein